LTLGTQRGSAGTSRETAAGRHVLRDDCQGGPERSL